MRKSLGWFCLAVSVFVGGALPGCGDAQTGGVKPTTEQHDHDHESADGAGDHAPIESLSEVIAEVDELRAKIESASAAGNLEEAHEPLHEVGHLLEELSRLAGEASLSEAEQQTVKQSVETLMDSFSAIDERLHAGNDSGASYDEVAAKIDAALSNLKAIGIKEPTS